MVRILYDGKRVIIIPVYKTGKKMFWEMTDHSASLQLLEERKVQWVLIEVPFLHM